MGRCDSTLRVHARDSRRHGSWNLVELQTGLKVDLFFKGDMLAPPLIAGRL